MEIAGVKIRKFLLVIGLILLLLGTTACDVVDVPVELVGDGKIWLEFRPELDFDIVRKNAVPVSYGRGIFTGFELPIWADDNQELFFRICVPGRWDGISTSHIHLDVFLIGAQDKGDAFRLEIVYEYYDTGVDVVPNTSTAVEVETATGASVAFQSFPVHFEVPAGNMVCDDVLAFRLRRIAVTEGVEIDGNIVFNHIGINFYCDKYGNPTIE